MTLEAILHIVNYSLCYVKHYFLDIFSFHRVQYCNREVEKSVIISVVPTVNQMTNFLGKKNMSVK